ncbi:heme biosynthesis HemY N-terminal domain-containing protein [Legionella nagasakiensis]|uniref:heme biosynthesis HemY N-terminal domain-containing protein n=1 Tax=Legionella nagasakiensis TaxID=535290 RepID=UPI0010558D56|nr:heme biosynthesis HemY N-terminal domain-containing protein [Legionella nagasakiensis]
MIRVLFIFILLLASVWLGLQLQQDPGYVLIAMNQWTLETTLWVAVIGLILFFFLFYLLVALLNWILHVPASWKNWLAKHRAQKAQMKTRQGLIEFSEGYWLQAKNHLIKALPDADTPLLNYLTAARAAQEMGDNKLRDDYLRQAQQSMPEAKIAVELTQAQLQLANRQWEQALATLKHLQTLAPQHPYVLKLLMHLYKEVRDWSQLINLLPELKSNHIVSGDAYKRLQQYAYLQAMSDMIKQNQLQTLEEQFSSLPKSLKHDPELVALYCRSLIENQKYSPAESLLRRCLSKQFNEELITLYGQIKHDLAQLDFAESLLREQPHSAALFLCLGRLSQMKSLWGKAKTYLENSIALSATPTAYAELGKLLEHLNDEHGACIAYRHGLLLATQQS